MSTIAISSPSLIVSSAFCNAVATFSAFSTVSDQFRRCQLCIQCDDTRLTPAGVVFVQNFQLSPLHYKRQASVVEKLNQFGKRFFIFRYVRSISCWAKNCPSISGASYTPEILSPIVHICVRRHQSTNDSNDPRCCRWAHNLLS